MLFLFMVFSLLNADSYDVIILVYIGLFLIVVTITGGFQEFMKLIA